MPRYSSHFDGRCYYNPGAPHRPRWKIAWWMLTRRPVPWKTIPIEQQKIPQQRTAQGECSVTFINHATVLLQLEGWNILTDPIWSERASPFSWWGPKRVCLPGVKFEDLPPIDIVLLSHNHYDHMDLATLKRLAKEHQPMIYVSKGNQAYLEANGITSVKELDWWDQEQFSLIYTLHFVPAQHFSARGFFDHNKTLWGGFVLKGPKQSIYFAGDTGYGPHFEEIKHRLGPPALSILPIGAYAPRWFLKTVHLNPEEAVKAHLDLASKQSLAMHFGTFQLTDEDFDAPLHDLEKALKHYELPPDCFWILKPGETKKFD